jgi:hypothetical protein
MYFDGVKRIVAFGDSNTYGHGMHDADNKDFNSPSKLTWVNVVANYFGVPVENKAMPGSGNDSIFRVFNDYMIGDIFQNDNYNRTPRFSAVRTSGDAVLIGLSLMYRAEVYEQKYKSYGRILSQLDYDTDPDAKKAIMYILMKETEETLCRKLLYNIHNIMCQCIAYNVPYIICHAIIDGWYFIPDNPLGYNRSLISKIEKPSWIKEPMHGSIAKTLGKQAFLPCNHPNKIGHEFWGNRIIEHIKHYDKSN